MQETNPQPTAEFTRPTHSFLIKTAAVALFTLLTLTALFGLGGAAFTNIDRGVYGAQDGADSQLIRDLIHSYNNQTANAYSNLYRASNGAVTADALAEVIGRPDGQSNYRYVVTDESGTVLAGNIAGQNVKKAGAPDRHESAFIRLPSGELAWASQLWYAEQDSGDIELNMTVSEADAGPAEEAEPMPTPILPADEPAAGAEAAQTAPTPTPIPLAPQETDAAASDNAEPEIVRLNLNVQGYLLDPLAVNDDLSARISLVTRLQQNRNAMLLWGVICAVAALFVFIFLMCAAGRHRDSLAPRRGFIDRIPFDLLLALSCGVLALDALALGALDSLYSPNIFALYGWVLALICVLAAVNILWALMMCMTFAARIKTRTLLRNNVCVYIVTLCWRLIKAVCRWLKNLFADLPLLWKGIVAFFGIGLFLLLTYTAARTGSGFAGFLCFAATAALFVLLLAVIRQADALKKGGESLARGDLSQQVDTRRMLPELKKHGDNLNSIAAGMNAAVNERMKSERMKTDLITNVSHDLKTPLTSIVSYVDLLKKEELHNATAAEYVAVLDRQAARLKKLTEDLVDASKASSGALKVCLAPTDVLEILNQSLAEYADRLQQAELTPILTRRTGTVTANAGSVAVTASGSALEACDPLFVQADGRLLWRVFDNLLNNIVKYALPGTRVYIDVVRDAHSVAVVFKNISREPLNIPAAELTERFVRGDASRNSEGSGLGLSIAKSLAELQKAVFALDISGDLFTTTVAMDLSPVTAAPAGFDCVQIAQVEQADATTEAADGNGE